MKVGDKVIVSHPNRFIREMDYWQPFNIIRIIKQHTDTIVQLQGLCCPNIEITGESITALEPWR